VTVSERPVTLRELAAASAEGRLREVLGAGTACVVQPVERLVGHLAPGRWGAAAAAAAAAAVDPAACNLPCCRLPACGRPGLINDLLFPALERLPPSTHTPQPAPPLLLPQVRSNGSVISVPSGGNDPASVSGRLLARLHQLHYAEEPSSWSVPFE
jgi:hypothetical protein